MLCDRNVRWYLSVAAGLTQATTEGEHFQEVHLAHPSQILRSSEDITEQLELVAQALSSRITEFTSITGSGWTVQSIDYIDLHIAAYDPILGSSYVPTPGSIDSKNAILNIENKDNRCFVYAVLASLYPVFNQEEACKPESYEEYIPRLNWDGLEFPMSLS